MPKEVLGPNEVIEPDGQRTPRCASKEPKHTRLNNPPVRHPKHYQDDLLTYRKQKTLDCALLSKIKSFYIFAGCFYNANANALPTMLVKVEYHSGSSGWAHCPLLIKGQPKDIDEALSMYTKIRFAKELVGDANWVHLEERVGYTKETSMVFEWFEIFKRLNERRDIQSNPGSIKAWHDYAVQFGFCAGLALGPVWA